jgi:streptogramin lyase
VAVIFGRAVALVLVAMLAACGTGGGQPVTSGQVSTQRPVTVGTIVTTVPVGDEALSMAFDGRYLWVGSAKGGVTQVDTSISQPIRTIKLPGRPVNVAVTADAVWVADNAGATVTRIDPATGMPAATVRVGANPLGLAQLDGDLWVFSQSEQRATVLDPRTNQVKRTVPLPGLGAGYPAVATGGIWVPDLAGTTRSLWRVDPGTGLADLRLATRAHPAEVAFGFGSGWVTDDDGVIRFNPATGKEEARIDDVGRRLDGIVATTDSIWTVSIDDNLLSRIDPGTNRPVASLSVCTGPRHLTVVKDDIWVSCFDAGMLVRIHPS